MELCPHSAAGIGVYGSNKGGNEMEWTLKDVLGGIHQDISQRLGTARKALGHSVTLGDASENVWLELLTSYLPRRYEAAKAHVVGFRGRVQPAD